jgi:prepilin-type N-terminal cleavage/methylation domain-containing protein
MKASLERLRRRRDLGEEGGFTLIELLIVIVILGILAAIVVFAVQNLTSQSSKAACQSQYKTLETAQEAYKAQMGSYASSFALLNASTTSGVIGGGSAGPWIKDLPNTTSGASVGDYYGIDAANGSIEVGNNTGALADGNGNCAYLNSPPEAKGSAMWDASWEASHIVSVH